jgi:hypothetical protein
MGSNVSFYNLFVVFVVRKLKLTPMGFRRNDNKVLSPFWVARFDRVNYRKPTLFCDRPFFDKGVLED